MEFLTLHELSRELNKPERQLRHKFKNLLKKNTLVEGEDFIREGYIDDQHFVFKINPVRFVELTQLNPAPLPDQNGYHVDNKFVNNLDTKHTETDTTGGNQPEKNAASDPQPSMQSAVVTDFIELMKEQLREKDKQLKEKDDQLKSKDELLKQAQIQAKDKDNAQILALSEIIRLNKKLLPASPGEQVIDVDATGYQPGNQMATNSDNQTSEVDNSFGTNG